MPSAKILEAKKAYVAELNTKIAGSLAGVVVAYNGISVADDTKMRKELREAGVELVLVSSGAVAAGMSQLGWTTRPSAMNELQAAASLGQMRLVQAWESSFGEHGKHTAQILLTHDDLSDRKRYLNARSTLRTLVELGAIPVINENDTVVNDEIKFGDNDTLGALVANLVDADVLIILTDQPGLYTADPRSNPAAEFVHQARAGDPALEAMAGGAGSSIGKGGMLTKILAAKRAAGSGTSTVIAWGREHNVLLRLCQGESIGTALLAPTQKLQARKQWMLDHLQLPGAVQVDAGAAAKLQTAGKSLLPIGMVAVSGEFSRGDVIAVRNPEGQEIARGLANYSSAEARLLCKHSSSEIAQVLGYSAEPEMLHRDNMVVLH